jgi:ABC-type polysaccharide/polyol phosphate transport system ATPase subunit
LESLIEKIRKPGNKTNIELSSQLMQAASVESKEVLVRRMYIVAKSIAMFNKEVESMEFLGIVGAEDAGKSTFTMVG